MLNGNLIYYFDNNTKKRTSLGGNGQQEPKKSHKSDIKYSDTYTKDMI
jgi:hypothetical protein